MHLDLQIFACAWCQHFVFPSLTVMGELPQHHQKLLLSIKLAGMLALHGIFTLVTRHGLEYPRFYERLYQLLTPAAFQVRGFAWSCSARAPQLHLWCMPLQALTLLVSMRQGDAYSELPDMGCKIAGGAAGIYYHSRAVPVTSCMHAGHA